MCLKFCNKCPCRIQFQCVKDWIYFIILRNRACYKLLRSWLRHQMEIFSALLALCAGNSSVTGEFPSQRPVTRSFDVFFDLRLNKRLSKQPRGWWFETLSCQLWRHSSVSYWRPRCKTLPFLAVRESVKIYYLTLFLCGLVASYMVTDREHCLSNGLSPVHWLRVMLIFANNL